MWVACVLLSLRLQTNKQSIVFRYFSPFRLRFRFRFCLRLRLRLLGLAWLGLAWLGLAWLGSRELITEGTTYLGNYLPREVLT